MKTTQISPSLDLKSSAIAFIFAYQQQDVEKMLGLCNPEGSVWFKPLGASGKGKIGELGKNLWTALIDCFPDLENTVNAANLETDGSVRCLVDIRGVQAKEFAGIPSKGLFFETEHVFIFRHDEDNQINSIEIEWDHQDFARQLSNA